ncbi:MAG: hypothetical protein ABW155_17235 [Candidatus Thiodiazotropha sp.]
MKIAVISQNFRTITQHAGNTRRFLIYKQDPLTAVTAVIEGKPLPPSEVYVHGQPHPPNMP